MTDAENDRWTPTLVIRALRVAFSRAPRLGNAPAMFSFVATAALTDLGSRSPEFIALMLRARAIPAGLSLREMCRERAGWQRSRAALYRRSDAGAVRVAAALNAEGVAVPAALVAMRWRPGRDRRRRELASPLWRA